jgi:phospholipid/cholesterol/gamma-HCH transport system substrate-binding protein
MPKEKNYKWKLGLFSVVVLVLAISAIYYIGKQKNLFGSVFRITAQFNSVSGLKVGSNVRLDGIDVGTVDDIELVTDTTVQVDMIIQKGVEKFIRKDAKASIGSDGLMGDKVIVLAAGTPDTGVVRNGDALTSRQPIETDQIIASLKVTADNAAIITSNLADITSRITHGKGTLGKLLHDTTPFSQYQRHGAQPELQHPKAGPEHGGRPAQFPAPRVFQEEGERKAKEGRRRG